MLVLPRMTAPGRVEPLRDVGVVGPHEAFQDAAAGGRRTPRRHDQVLERDRDPHQRRQRRHRVGAGFPGRRQAAVGGLRRPRRRACHRTRPRH